MARPDAVIFDLGGTLAEPQDWTGAARRALERMGLGSTGVDSWVAAATERVGAPAGPKTGRKRLRRRREAWARALLEASGVTEGLRARGALLKCLLETEILWRHAYPEVPDTLDRLVAEGYRLAVASNNDGRTSAKIGALGLLHPFEAIVDSIEEKTRKPEPGLLLRAAELLGLPPERCVYVGNDPSRDVVAARAAGMPVVWVDRDGRGPGRWGADILLPDLTTLPGAIRGAWGTSTDGR